MKQLSECYLGVISPRLEAPELLAVLLQVAGHVLPRHAVHIHQLQDRLGHSVLDPLQQHAWLHNWPQQQLYGFLAWPGLLPR